MRRLISALLMIVVLAALAACSQAEAEPGGALEPTAAVEPRPTPTTETGDTDEATPAPEPVVEANPAVEAARERLGDRLGVDPDTIEVVSASEMEWPDGCLGLAEPDEMCTMAIVPGWQVILRVPGETGLYEARTDATGNTVRFQQMTDAGGELPAAAVRAREELAAELGTGIEAVEVVRFTQEQWTDSCLGLGGPAESCLQVITPGWLVILAADGKQYEAHTDRTGDSVRISNLPLRGDAGARPFGEAVVIFEQSGGFAGETVTYRVYRDGVVEKESDGSGVGTVAAAVITDTAAVEELLADLEDAGFFELEEDQMPADPCCDRFNYMLTATSGTQSNTIRTVEGTEGLPSAVWESIELVERFVEMSGTLPTS
ncbi:MAG: hypothetical protein RRC07_11160 [Anaerolineae bacterium]|nr:hypothetical protein [Anaerolineae bacterium]